MRNSSHNPGCMRRLPASHSCQPRRVQWMSAAAAVCDRPAASRAARTSAGSGFAEGPFGPRFGWLGIDLAAALVGIAEEGNAEVFPAFFGGNLLCLDTSGTVGFCLERVALLGVRTKLGGFVVGGIGDGHFQVLPQYPRRGGQQRAAHEVNYTRIACSCKNFLRKFNEAPTPPHNAEVSGLSTRPPG